MAGYYAGLENAHWGCEIAAFIEGFINIARGLVNALRRTLIYLCLVAICVEPDGK